MSPERTADKKLRDYAFHQMEVLQNNLKVLRDRVIGKVRKLFSLPEKKDDFIREIMEEARPSTLELLDKYKAKIREDDANRIQPPKKNRGEMSR
jgi:hypothetical protein